MLILTMILLMMSIMIGMSSDNNIDIESDDEKADNVLVVGYCVGPDGWVRSTTGNGRLSSRHQSHNI